MSKPKVCILHLGGSTTEPLKPFDEVSWAKVVDIHQRRHSVFTSSKFFAITLPDKLDSSMGYHSKCYKNFTALPSKPEQSSSKAQSEESLALLRSHVSHPSTSSSGVFEQKCIFCNKVRKKISRDKPEELLTTVEYSHGEISIQAAAERLNDTDLLAKISGLDLIAKELKFHHSCRRSYTSKAKRLRDDASSQEPSAHEQALAAVKSHVQETLIDNQGAEKLASLLQRYTDALGYDETAYSAQKLCDRLLKDFPGALKTYKRTNKEGLVLYNHLLETEVAYRRANFDPHSLKEAAFYLRKCILSSKVTEQPTPLSVEAIQVGQGNKPEELMEFFRILYTGSCENGQNAQVERLIDSVTDDVVYATSHARMKPGKHISLAIAMKSLTGSRRVIEILNRFGHCSGYHVAESIETQFATEIAARNTATPDGMSSEPDLYTSLAWDNYDEMTETLSGKGTLHATVGICYQNIPESDHPVTQPARRPEEATCASDTQQKCSLRTFKLDKQQLEPYRKKPKRSSFVYEIKDKPDPPHLLTIQYRDLFWMMNMAIVPKTPMWIGWNSCVTPDPFPKQQIGYMENINLPPTRLDVVAQTLKQSRVAQECHQEYVIVTYDLAVAKLAMQIQLAEAPLFDNVFICFGAFHIMLAYFASLGYLLDGSGGPDILTESEVLAAGSLNGFMSGKHYNR